MVDMRFGSREGHSQGVSRCLVRIIITAVSNLVSARTSGELASGNAVLWPRIWLRWRELESGPSIYGRYSQVCAPVRGEVPADTAFYFLAVLLFRDRSRYLGVKRIGTWARLSVGRRKMS